LSTEDDGKDGGLWQEEQWAIVVGQPQAEAGGSKFGGGKEEMVGAVE